MSKIKYILLIVAALVLVAFYFLGTPRENRYPEATLPALIEAETGWYAAGITYYRLSVEITFADERRLHMVTVKDQQILEGTVAYWDNDLREWRAPKPMGEEEAYWYTVPGLFETVRAAILKECRSFVRMSLEGVPPFPRVIVLGPPELDGEIVEDVVSWVEVREFTPLAKDEG